MKVNLDKWWERLLGAFKYILGIAMVWSGYNAATEPLIATEVLGFIYSSRTALVILGVVFVTAGLVLFVGKLLKRRKMVGLGLMMTFCSFVFAVVVNAVAFGFALDSNFLLMIAVGLLYLRWRFKTAYIDPNHFRDDAERLRYSEHHRLAEGDR